MSGERLLLDSTFVAGLINSRDQLHLKAKDFLSLVETAAEVLITEAVSECNDPAKRSTSSVLFALRAHCGRDARGPSEELEL
jgi:hypothetical protein